MEQVTSKELNPFDVDLARIEKVRRTDSSLNTEFLLGFIDKLWNEYSRTQQRLDDCAAPEPCPGCTSPFTGSHFGDCKVTTGAAQPPASEPGLLINEQIDGLFDALTYEPESSWDYDVVRRWLGRQGTAQPPDADALKAARSELIQWYRWFNVTHPTTKYPVWPLDATRDAIHAEIEAAPTKEVKP